MRRSITKKRKKPDKKKALQKEANRLWNLACFERWSKVCNCCGDLATANHHFVEKSRCNNLRYDFLNGVPICQRCHYIIGQGHDTLKRRALEDRIIKVRGARWLSYIETQSKVLVKTNIGWLEERIAELRDFINE